MQWHTDFGLPWRLIFITALARGVPTGHLQPHFLALTGLPLAAPVPSATYPTPVTQSVPQTGFQLRRRWTLLGCCRRRRRRRCHCRRRRRHRGWCGRRLRRAACVGVAFAKYPISSSGKKHLEFLVGLISVLDIWISEHIKSRPFFMFDPSSHKNSTNKRIHANASAAIAKISCISCAVKLCPFNLVAWLFKKRKATRIHNQQTRDNTCTSITCNQQSIRRPLRGSPSILCGMPLLFRTGPKKVRPVWQLQFFVLIKSSIDSTKSIEHLHTLAPAAIHSCYYSDQLRFE